MLWDVPAGLQTACRVPSHLCLPPSVAGIVRYRRGMTATSQHAYAGLPMLSGWHLPACSLQFTPKALPRELPHLAGIKVS